MFITTQFPVPLPLLHVLCGRGWSRSLASLIHRSSYGEEPLKELHPKYCIWRASSAPGPHKTVDFNAVMKWELCRVLGRWVYIECGKNIKHLWPRVDFGSFKTQLPKFLTFLPSIWFCGFLANIIQCKIKILCQFQVGKRLLDKPTW